MSRRIAPLLALAAMLSVLTLWLVAVPLVSAGDPCYHGFEMPAATVASDTEIKLDPCAFAPTVANVAVGATVTFRNGSGFTHLITGANQAWGSRDVEVQPSKTAAYTFDKAGVYPYACALHRGMSGVIVVGDVALAAGNVGSVSGAGTTTSGTGATAAASQPGAAPATSPTDGLWLVAIGAAGGLIVGALLAWVSMRRRAVRREEPAPGIA